ncbi:MAG: signal recognition particle-docking protein FtsY [Ilumatobacteraceae bacterium]
MIGLTSSLIFPLLALVVVVFGIGVLILSRRRRMAGHPNTVTTNPVSTVAPVSPITVSTPSLRDRLAKTRNALAGAVSGVLTRSEIDEATWSNLEEALLLADIGVRVTHNLLDGLRQRVKNKEIVSPHQLVEALRLDMASQLRSANRELVFDESIDGPNIWLIVGVNGAGKTTTIGKLSAQQVAGGRSVLLAAGDTFRAAAVEQLGAWAERSGATLIRGAEGSDPSSVIFDAVQSAHSRRIDLVIADTAGRLQTNTNLMEELKKVRRVAEKGVGKVTEVLLVIDATTGQNGLVQARQFALATQVTGVVLSKLDGSAKGGIVFAIETELGIPVKLIGIGETIDDMAPFNPDEFIAALFDQ